MKVLITGVSGTLGRSVAQRLVAAGHSVLGIDRRPWPDAPAGVEVFLTDIRKRAAEDVFRKRKPEVVIHLATVTHLAARRDERARINLGGTRAVFEYCDRHAVKHAIFISRHTVYGAAADAPLYRKEAEPPLGATTFPSLADLVAADLYAGSSIWRYPKLRTSILRLVYTLGPSRRGTLANFLSGKRVPLVLGFDPLFQFMHEHDAAEAVIRTVEARPHGVFNVTGPSPVPLSVLVRATGRVGIPIPELLFGRMVGRFGFSRVPRASMSHIKHPIVVDGALFREATGFEHAFDEVQVMDGYRWQ